MTYTLPFGLKQKPLSHYFAGGSVRFNIVEGDMRYIITHTTKTRKSVIKEGWVYNKEQLEKLLSIKSIHEIPSLEQVK